MTFSIVARSEAGRFFGEDIASSSPAVAARCAHARSAAGAVASQNITDPVLGPKTLDALMSEAATAALKSALASTPFGGYRQLLAIGRWGPPEVHAGSQALGVVSRQVGEHCAAAGNLL